MKRKYILLLFLMGLFAVNSFVRINAYSPHYLPGGKNYLSVDNYSVDGDYYSNIESFLVKPYTEYTLSIPGSYGDEPYVDIDISFLDNETTINTVNIYAYDMFFYGNSEGDWYSYTFVTTSDTNYLDISFRNSNNYFMIMGFDDFQLEEGLVATSYEPYIEGSLIDTSAPYFQNAGTVISYFDSPITVSEIQSALVAYDAIDGNVTENILLISDNYTANINVIGSYDVVFEVEDNSGNASQITIDIELVDVLNPVFSNIGTIQAVYPNVYTSEDILSMLSASDNYDGDISNQINLISDGYSSNASFVGTYQMTFSVFDSSGNEAEYIQNIAVVDNDSPIISGITSVIIGYDEIISSESVSGNLTYNDNYDDQSTLELILVSDNYTQNHSNLGDYEMVYSVTDSSGNTTYQTVDISVVDELGPMVYFDASIVQTYNDTVMALPDFTQLLVNANEIDRFQDYYITINYDSYTRNARTPGIYHLSLNFNTESGETFNKDLEIRVLERPIDYVHIGDNESVDKTSFIAKNIEYFIGGTITLMLLVSNVVWIVILKKRS